MKKYFHFVKLTINKTMQEPSFGYHLTLTPVKGIKTHSDDFLAHQQTLTHLVLVRVAELRIHHVYDAASVRSHIEAELLLPGPSVSASDPGLVELLYHADVVDDVQDEGL